jgi:hypothetical protein
MRVYHYLEAKWALDDIRRRRLKLSKIDDMNDPYEWKCVRTDDGPSQLALEKVASEIAETRGPLCFSRSWNNILMWSHYGDRHRGMCLGFDVPDELKVEMTYVGDLLMVENLSEASVEEKKRAFNRLDWTKYGGWCYEEEVRIYASRAEMDEETRQYFVDFSDHLKLKEVIAGARFKLSKKPIEDALKGYSDDVRIIKAARSISRFEIIVDERGFS